MNTEELENGVPLAEAIFCPACGTQIDVWFVDPMRPVCPHCDINLVEPERI
jgi:hypothetical protein